MACGGKLILRNKTEGAKAKYVYFSINGTKSLFTSTGRVQEASGSETKNQRFSRRSVE